MARESVDLQNGSLLKKMPAFALPLMATYFQIPESHTLKTLYAAYPLSWGLTTVVLYAFYLPVRRKFPKESVKKAAD